LKQPSVAIAAGGFAFLGKILFNKVLVKYKKAFN
jgi:hypothetical protein